MARRPRSDRSLLAASIVVALALGSGTGLTTSASGSVTSSFVPIAPCRLIDTRPAADNVGARIGPVSANETFVATVWGTNGKCTIPTTATAVSLNVAIVNPTSGSYLTVFPADASPRPLAANLNWVANQAPTPNAVTAALSADGKIAFYNLTGNVDLSVDVNGYYVAASAGGGPQGPPGPPGPPGPGGPTGPAGSATAWGRIAGTATVPTIAVSSSNVSAVFRSQPHTGVGTAAGSYCIRFNPPIAQARMRSAVVSGYSGNGVIAVASSSYCFGDELGVLLFAPSTGVALSGDFNFLIP